MDFRDKPQNAHLHRPLRWWDYPLMALFALIFFFALPLIVLVFWHYTPEDE